MAIKDANVMAHVEPKIKEQAEMVLEHLGLPVSVVINTLYRQIIMKNGLPFPLVVPHMAPSRSAMTDEEFDALMLKGLEEAKAGDGMSLDEAFMEISESI